MIINNVLGLGLPKLVRKNGSSNKQDGKSRKEVRGTKADLSGIPLEKLTVI